MPNVFQPGKSAGLNATFHFTFTGREQRQATVVIQKQRISVNEGHVGHPDLRVTADSQTWIGFLRNERNVVWALLRRKIRLEGPLKLLVAFGKCFPSADARHELVENGIFVFSGKKANRVVLIGGGVGITPLMSVVRYLAATSWPGKMHLILGFRSPRDFIFREELAELQARNANLGVTVTMSGPHDEPWSGRVGRIDASLLASTVPNLTAHRVHVCGPPLMMDAVKAALVSLGVPHDQIKTEAFGTIKRDPTAKDAGSKEIAGRAFFLASGVTATVPVDATILDAADTAGVSIDNACRSGTCASCRVKRVSGQVTMAVEDALTDQDRAEGYILACQAKIQGDIEVDA